jgi:3-hydroxymyristoyl/3-hydroxydecanoyl-(acyl carrier protein) dehydratase
MRYRFIDGVTSLELGAAPRIEVTKTFDAADDLFTGPSGSQHVPNSMILELLAMTGGYLAFRRLDETRLPLLLKAPDVAFETPARPGERLVARAELRGLSDPRDGVVMAEASGEVVDGATRIASGRLLFACVALPGIDLRRLGDPA